MCHQCTTSARLPAAVVLSGLCLAVWNDPVIAMRPGPGCPGEGGCCAGGGNGTPGCDDPACCELICAMDPFCCDTLWDGICADAARDLCSVCQVGECDSDDDCPPGFICFGEECICEITCPDGAIEEDEVCGEDTNGGCNSTPPVFMPAECGQTFCGTAWADNAMRDTDWYLVNHPGGTISSSLNSEFPGVNFIVDGIARCEPAVVGDLGCADPCNPISEASDDLPAGQYVIFVAPGNCADPPVFDGYPCGVSNNYVLSISCGCAGDEDCPEGEVCSGGFCEAGAIEGNLDIRPGGCPNPLNRSARGYTPVALVGTGEIDAELVDLSTLSLSRADGVGGSAVPHEGPPGPSTIVQDVVTPFDGELCDCHELAEDGITDVSMRFSNPDLVGVLELDDVSFGAVELCLSGNLLDGTAFHACDCVLLVPPNVGQGSAEAW